MSPDSVNPHPDSTRADRRADLFERAADLPAVEREAFLRNECGDDAELAREVLELLDLEADLPPGFLPGTGGAPAPPGSRIGPYEVLERLGEGGMGTVYAARQAFPRRDVALKVIRPGKLSTAANQRFQHEVQALANLQHAGIAQIYDAGTAVVEEAGAKREEPYLAMELVRGRPLVDYADQKGLALHERLELLARVCDAVHHAHQRGVIHRDLKPENVLVVDDETTIGTPDPSLAQVGQPKVLDFGIARITGDSAPTRDFETRAGELVGTLAYMSPEQLEGGSHEIDARSDVYALGVILYRLVSGRLPHNLLDLTVPQAIERLRNQEPPLLGALNAELRGDVATIADRALEKERDRRYGSAAELAADIRRHLRGEPIHARATSSFYRLHRKLRRHKVVLTVAVIGSAILGALSVVLVQQVEQKEVLATSAEAGFDSAMGAIEALITTSEERLAKEPQNTKARRQLLEEAQRLFASLSEQASEDPQHAFRIAKAMSGVGYIQYHVGDVEGSMASNREAIEQLDAVAPHGLGSVQHRGQSLSYLGQAHHHLGEIEEAEAAYRAALDVTRVALEEQPDNASAARNYGAALKYVARIDRDTGKARESEDALEEGIGLLEDVVAQVPDDVQLTRTLVSLHEDFANQLVGELRWEDADEHLRRGLELAEELYELDPNDAGILYSITGLGVNYGQVLYETGREEEAIELYELTIERGEALTAMDPSATSYRSQLSQAYGNLGAIYGMRDEVPEIERCLGRAHELTLTLLEDAPDVLKYHGKLGTLNTNLGAFYVFQGQYDEAIEVLLEGRAAFERVLSTYPGRLSWQRALVDLERNLGMAYLGQGRHANAIEIVRTAPPAREVRTVGQYLSLVSRSMGLVYQDEALPFDEREELGREYVIDAIEFMDRTIEGGLQARHFPNEGALSTLLEDPEFEGYLDYVEVTFAEEK